MKLDEKIKQIPLMPELLRFDVRYPGEAYRRGHEDARYAAAEIAEAAEVLVEALRKLTDRGSVHSKLVAENALAEYERRLKE